MNDGAFSLPARRALASAFTAARSFSHSVVCSDHLLLGLMRQDDRIARLLSGRGITRAALEGIAFSLRDAFDVLTAKGLTIREAAMIGGGSRSPLWQSITSNVLGLRLRVPQNSDSSFASAMLAGIGTGVFASLDDALGKCASFVAEIEPDAETHAFYEERFRIYRAVHDALAPIYRMQ